jgi:hypothetical protein
LLGTLLWNKINFLDEVPGRISMVLRKYMAVAAIGGHCCINSVAAWQED